MFKRGLSPIVAIVGGVGVGEANYLNLQDKNKE